MMRIDNVTVVEATTLGTACRSPGCRRSSPVAMSEETTNETSLKR